MAPRFAILRRLGAGAQGTVALAFDAERGEHVAVKRVAARAGATVLHLKSEFRAVAEISHPGLVRLYELGQDRDGLFFTMEAVDGVTLDEHLREGAPELPVEPPDLDAATVTPPSSAPGSSPGPDAGYAQ